MNMKERNGLGPISDEITIFKTGDPDENPWILGKLKHENIEVEPYNPQWAGLSQKLKKSIAPALAEKTLAIEHIGSTAVPGLPAKPVVDIGVIINDPENENTYVPALEAIGYTLTVRERSWHQHRMFRHEFPRVNVHIFGVNCSEHIRHLLFRDWLCSHPKDQQRYAEAKRLAKNGTDTVQSYNSNKQTLIREIYQKISAFYGFSETDIERNSSR